MSIYIEQKFINGMSIEEYHSLAGFVSSSGLKELAKSPAHYKTYLESGNGKRTPSMEFGDAAHNYILQPAEFERRYAVMPSNIKVRRGKEYEAFQEANAGKTVLAQDDIEALCGMADSLSRHTTASQLIRSDDGIAEMSCFFACPETGIHCRFRPDFLPGGDIIVDYKTTENASASEFPKACIKYGYDIQAALYLYGMEILTGVQHRFIFVAHEKKPPYEIGVYEASHAFIESGKVKMHRLLSTLMNCRETGVWPGYPDEIQTLDLPSWAKAA